MIHQRQPQWNVKQWIVASSRSRNRLWKDLLTLMELGRVDFLWVDSNMLTANGRLLMKHRWHFTVVNLEIIDTIWQVQFFSHYRCVWTDAILYWGHILLSMYFLFIFLFISQEEKDSQTHIFFKKKKDWF